jgi:hypothetical protein
VPLMRALDWFREIAVGLGHAFAVCLATGCLLTCDGENDLRTPSVIQAEFEIVAVCEPEPADGDGCWIDAERCEDFGSEVDRLPFCDVVGRARATATTTTEGGKGVRGGSGGRKGERGM